MVKRFCIIYGAIKCIVCIYKSNIKHAYKEFIHIRVTYQCGI